MDDLTSRKIEALGREAAKVGDERVPSVVDEARARFLGEGRRAPRPRRPGRIAVVAAAVLVAAVLVGVLVRRPPAAPAMTFAVAARPGATNEWVTAPPAEDVPLQFSDGTTVLLSAGARGNVTDLASGRARVRIEKGGAAVSVSPRTSVHWTFDVGPFAVAVTGTRFDASWEPVKEVFELDVRDGSVRVTGPTIDGEKSYVAGQHLRIALAVNENVLAPPAPSASSAPEPAVSTPKPALSPKTTWRDLARAGQYKDALAEASPAFDEILRTSSADDAMLLGDAARLGGDPTKARRAYGAVRARHPGTPSAALAAFSLGRMAAQDDAQVEAARLFETYLSESPNGPLAREALGRAMEARDRLGEVDASKRLAHSYLEKYPDGPHAKLAHKIAGH